MHVRVAACQYIEIIMAVLDALLSQTYNLKFVVPVQCPGLMGAILIPVTASQDLPRN